MNSPPSAAALLEQAVQLHQQGRAIDALAAMKAMTELFPTDPRGFHNLALLCLLSGQHVEAEAAAARSRALDPMLPETIALSAEVAFAMGNFEAAEEMSRQTLALNPDAVPAHRVLAEVMMRDLRYESAIVHYERALAGDNNHADMRANYAMLLVRMGRHTQAVEEYKKSLRFRPDHPEARVGLAVALLALGRLDEGWPMYAARTITRNPEENPSDRPLSTRAVRPGECLGLICDQGIGEQILFASLLPDLFAITADIELQCDARLNPLIQRSFPQIRFVSPTAKSWKISGTLADAARWLRPNFQAFPRHAGYLKADVQKRDALRARYRGGGNAPLIGISWMSDAAFKFAPQKSTLLQDWHSILSRRPARFVSLQYGNVREDVAATNAALGADIFVDPDIDAVEDVDGFAAQVAAMDFVITTSNTTAHVAGALNIPTLVLVPLGFGGLWHWFLEREDSPWYSSVRLLRQSRWGEWNGALEEASSALAAFLSARRQDAK